MKSKPVSSSKIIDLFNQIIEFNHTRGWHPDPHDIAKSIVIEAAELLELFQWDASKNNLGAGLRDKNVDDIQKELADVVWYIISFCHEADIDLAESLEKKIEHNEKKYPVAMFNGKHNDGFYKQRKAEYRKNKN